MNHVVYSGWMVKSPPERKLTGPWKIFRSLSKVDNFSNTTVKLGQKWKRRFFVLSKPAQSLPGTYNLLYYRDENCKKSQGSIDLEQCAEIIESLDSEQFDYLLAIKTTHRGRERTYFLATDTEEQMSTWVRNLCSVCGMKPDESVEPTSPTTQTASNEPVRKPQLSQPQASLPLNSSSMTRPPNPIVTKTTSSASTRGSPSSRAPPIGQQPSLHRQQQQPPKPTKCDREPEYIPLETCTSGTSIKRQTARQASVDSVPEELAPPPPVKRGPVDLDDVFQPSNNNNNKNDTYDVPPSVPPSVNEEDEPDDLYKVPPTRPTQSKAVKDMINMEPYDILPTHPSPSTPRSSSSESQKVDSAYSSQGLMYDTLPPKGEGLTHDDIYDVPPNHDEDSNEMPPLRPPKPQNLQHAQEPYMNLPPTSKMFNDKNKRVDINSVVQIPTPGMVQMNLNSDLYDIPKSDKSVNSVKNNSDTKDKLLSATPPPPVCHGPKEHKYINAYKGVVEPEQQDVYLQMDPGGPENKPRKSSSTDNEVEYTDMSGKSSFDESFEGKPNSIYDHPPPSQPSQPPPRPSKASPNDTYSIFSTARTRSFKKKSEGSPLIKKKSPLTTNSSSISSSKSTTSSVALPQRAGADRHPDFSTSDEDDDEMCSPDVWGTTPPAPANKDTELKYVDLDHDDGLDKEPMRSPHAGTSHLSPTEYHEIDFVRTDAIRNLKETVSSERSKDKRNT